jgi:hypothetical protein
MKLLQRIGWAGRIGYRRLYYDVEGDKGEFDGSFDGMTVGAGLNG